MGTWERVPIDALATLLKDFVLGNVELSLPRGSNPQMTNAALGCAEADTLSADLQLQTRCVTMALAEVLELLKADTRGVVTILRRLEVRVWLCVCVWAVRDRAATHRSDHAHRTSWRAGFSSWTCSQTLCWHCATPMRRGELRRRMETTAWHTCSKSWTRWGAGEA